MTVLYLNPGAGMGGAETSLTDLLAGLRAAHPDWQLHLLSGEEGPLMEEARQLGVATHVLPLPAKLAAAGDSGLRQKKGYGELLGKLFHGAASTHSYGRMLARAAAALRPDVIHSNGLKMHILAALYLRKRGRVLWHIHDYVSWRPVARRLLRLLAGRVEGALANSDSVAEDLRAVCPSLPWVQRVYNAVDSASLLAQAPLDLDQAAQAPPPAPGTLRIGLVATYARWKGHGVYLEALARLPQAPAWRAYIVGGAIYRTAGSQYSAEELQAEIRRLGLEGRVFLTGFLSGRGAIMRALDIVVHASTKPEPFGMVVVEAMACGRAVVVSRAGGAAEIFEEGETGLGHPPGDAPELARQIETLLTDESLRRRLAERGQSYAAQHFARPRLAAELSKLYQRVP